MKEGITLTDLFEVDVLQRIQDAFSKMTGFASIITDADGKPVTKGSNFTDFCKLYTRQSTLGCMRCEQCDQKGAKLALESNASISYRCHAGLLDFAAPIMAGDDMIGCFVGGQILTEPPDVTRIMQVAAELDIDLIGYLQAVINVRVMEREQVESASYFLYTLTDILSSIAYHKYEMHQANLEIEKAANLKSDFLANMSHEIRTPMNAVIGMAEMALREDLSDAAREYISQIKSSGKTLLTIINDILDFSKIESGKLDINPVPYEPLSVIYDVTNIINTRINSDDISFILDINPALPQQLLGDPIRIKQIITNISVNAVKFTQKGQVALHVNFSKQSEDSVFLQISVEDTGIGIKKADIGKLFQSFQQLDSKRNRNIEGTGLGLAISKQLLTLMKGDISVESTYQKGSTFSFYIPQKVENWQPSITLKPSEPFEIIAYLDNPFIKEQFSKDMSVFQLKYTLVSSQEELLSIPLVRNTYLFLEPYLFLPRLQQYVQQLPILTAVVMVPFGSLITYHIPNVLTLKQPVSALSLASVFNSEELLQDMMPPEHEYYDFTAPEAQILIVDDNAINLTVAKGLINPLNIQMDTADSGKNALARIEEKSYDIILMDHMMPDLDGIETTHLIRRFHKDYENVPIIALTANAVSDAKEMFLKEGMNDFIAKPIEIRTLVSILKKWLPPEKIMHGPAKAITTASPSIPLEIEGLDTNTALSLLGSETLFWSVLRDYYSSIPKKIALIKEFEKKEDWHCYTIEVHALKSASKQIGALALADMAYVLEQAGNEQNAALIHARTDELLASYYAYHVQIRPHLHIEDSAKKHTKSETLATAHCVLAQSFSQLRTAMDNLDLDAMEAVITELSSYTLSDEQKVLFSKLKNAVNDIDIDMCEQLLDKWENMLKGK